MRTSFTFSVLFWIYKKRAKNNQTNIYARITVNGKNANISLKHKVDINSWDAKAQKVRGHNAIAREMNLYLEEVKSQIVQCYRDLKTEKRILSSELIKSRYLGEDKIDYTLIDIFEYHNKNMAHKLKANTVGHYKTTQKHILTYLKEKYKTLNIHLQNLDYEFIIGLESFLRSYQSRSSQGTISNNVAMKHIQRLRKMITLAYNMEWIDRDPFVMFKPKIEKREREFLTEMELQRIESLSCPIDRLMTVKDLFVFGCYTGLSYVDIMKLKKDNILMGIDGSDWIMSERLKTKIPVKIPLLPVVESLIKKYENHPRTLYSGRLMPYLSNQKLNSYLKEIADMSGIKKNLTFHMARHTFATTVTLSNGVPIETVSKLLGHTKIVTTQIYARVIEKKIGEDMQKLKDRFSLNKQVQ
ncbi:Site-specific recombinase XerD [Flaviramulus basaltis]|uniref:Site-specific recombinase XerD n=1 Tax=Flaviramulus basaltis TaxID=369401 RepID=A0A1K2IAW1_9FLAO|nr:site-specific integrase [Flaviramulus basaltis]SFZ89556.1 Site-specific recombinase XerD [Flaviramulus basaltis]